MAATSASPPEPAATVDQMTPEEVHALASAEGLTHEQAVIATAIAWAESDLNPEASGDSALVDDTWGPSIGLWQVRSLHDHYGTGKERDGARLPEPEFNARAMVTISAGGTRWTPWSVYMSGRYRQHLEAVREAVEEPGEPMEGWMPDAIHTPPASRAGLNWVAGTAWKLLLHTTESNYRRSQGGRANYHGHQSYPHFEISEAAIEQYLPITVGAYALAPASEWGIGNGAHAVQAEIVWAAGNAANMSEKLLTNIARVLTWLREQTGMVPNLPPQGFPTRVSRGNWFTTQDWYDHEGLAGHGNVPGNDDRWDPGPLPAERIVALSDADFDPPPPLPTPQEEEDMRIIYNGNFLDTGGTVSWLTGDGAAAMLSSRTEDGKQVAVAVTVPQEDIDRMVERTTRQDQLADLMRELIEAVKA